MREINIIQIENGFILYDSRNPVQIYFKTLKECLNEIKEIGK